MDNHLEACELEGGYRKLCGAILIHTALSLGTRAASRGDGYGEELASQKSAAAEWVDGGVGRITFEEACDAIDMAPDYVRTGLKSYLKSPRRFKKQPWRRRRNEVVNVLPAITPEEPEPYPS